MNRMNLPRTTDDESIDGISLNDIDASSLGSKHGGANVHQTEIGAVSMVQRISHRLFHKSELDRALERPHITAIAFSGTVGIGIFVTTGELIGISGSLGCVVSFIGAAFIIIPVMRTLAELVSVRPVSGALFDYPHTFVDEALGFAVAISYWIAQCISMAVLTSAAARAADNFPDEGGMTRKGKIGIIIGFCLITLLSNLCGVRLYANLERVVMCFKLLLFICVLILMILIKAGVGRDSESQNLVARSETGYGNYSIVPWLEFVGFGEPEDLSSKGYKTGISGSWGQFLAIWTCITIALFACMGGDFVIVTAGEARHPRKDLAPVARFIYLVPVGLYIISSFLLGLNINFTNPYLYHPWAKPAVLPPQAPRIPDSPFIIVAAAAGIKVLPKLLNACFMISAYTAGNTAVFISSRTLFSISHLYGNQWMKDTFGTTNNGNTPIAAILFCSTFSLLAFLGLCDPTFNQPILSLSSFFTGTICCVYGSECIAFLRFKSGLTRLAQDVLDRDSPEYQKKHYRAHWQPLCAIFGLFGCIMMVLFSGWSAIYLLCVRKGLTTADRLKSPGSLVADVIGAYSGPVLFFILFFGYKFIKGTKFRRFRDFEDKYFMPEFDDEPFSRKRGWAREVLSFFIVEKSRKRPSI